MVLNKKTNGFLVGDIGDKGKGVEETYVATTNPAFTSPTTRNIFSFHAVKEPDMFEKGNIIHFGQKVKIATNPYLFRRELWLSSQPQSPSSFSPVSRK